MWLTAGYPWPDDPVASIFVRTQAQALSRLGASVTVVAPTPAVPWPMSRMRARWLRYTTMPRSMRDGDVLVIRPRYPGVPGEPSWAWPDRAIAAAAWRTRRQWSDATAIHGHFAVTGLAAWRVARRARLPFYLTFHGDDMNSWPDRHPERVADLRAAVSDARGVFAVSEALAKRVCEVTGVVATPLPLGSDHASIDRASLPRAEARRLLGLPEDKLIVLYVGYLLREKGVRELVDAMLGMGNPFIAVFVGTGPEHGYGAADLRAPGRLRFEGPRPHDEVVRYMCAADVLVLPSYGEGLPTVLVEAGSVGLPVVASAVGGIPQLLGTDRGTLLPEVSSVAIASAIAALTADWTTARARADRLRRHVRTEYDVMTNARHLLAYYDAAGDQRG
jgi:teichuronic acid biosynthesis glycosyltransferase TuaC